MRNAVLLCTALLLSLLIMGFMGCGEEAEEGEEKEDASGSLVSSAIPKNGAKNVPTTAAIVVTFGNDVMTPSSANLTFTPGATGDVSYDPGTRTLMFKPSAPLSNNTDYSMTIDGITDLEGNAMSPVTISFTTSVPDKKRPEITFTSPEDGQKDIIHDADILIRFSEPVDRLKLRSGITFDPKVAVSSDEWLLEWGVGDYEEVTIYPPVGVKPFEMNKEYTMYPMKDSVVDLSGNSIISDYKLKFRTLKYPVVEISNLNLPDGRVIQPVWMYTMGRIGGDWVVIWGGGVPPPGAPSRNNPAGTITASADGRIQDDIEYLAANPNAAHSESISKGNGNRLTFTSVSLNDIRHHRIIFRSTSKYLTFELRSASGVLPAKYVHIGSGFVNPSTTPFVLRNK